MPCTRSHGLRAPSLLVLALVAACTERVAAPASSVDVSAVSASTLRATTATRHIVHFRADAVPATFGARVASLGGTVVASYADAGLAIVDGVSPAGVAQLSADPAVEAIDADNVFRFVDAPTDMLTVQVPSVGAASPSNPATAFFYPRQWNMRVIRADAAWAAGQLGSPAVRVAIIDTGIDYLHPDLAGRVDLASSASFVPAEDPFVPILFPGREAFTDLNYHGTHVAATVSSNGLLAAGVGSGTSLLAVKVLDVNGEGSISAIVAGVIHAADRGADVLNLSLGVADLLSRQDRDVKAFERALDRVFRYVNRRGATVVVSAGNEAQDLDAKKTFKVFCGIQSVICVSATGPTSQGSAVGPWQNVDALASYSNFGKSSIDVAAPGGNGSTFVWAACSTTSLVIPACQTALFGLGLQGTSQAAPHAAGTLALMLARRPMPPAQLKNALGSSADDLGKPGKDDAYGRGRVNVRKALGL